MHLVGQPAVAHQRVVVVDRVLVARRVAALVPAVALLVVALVLGARLVVALAVRRAVVAPVHLVAEAVAARPVMSRVALVLGARPVVGVVAVALVRQAQQAVVAPVQVLGRPAVGQVVPPLFAPARLTRLPAQRPILRRFVAAGPIRAVGQAVYQVLC